MFLKLIRVPSHESLPHVISLLLQILYRPMLGVRRICSHPYLPYCELSIPDWFLLLLPVLCYSDYSFVALFVSDLAGDADGGVVMYEFGNHTPLITPHRQGAGGAITRIHYTPQGNKFGVTDTQGGLFMWQGIQSNKKDPFVVSYCL